jgi:hypothetical protein
VLTDSYASRAWCRREVLIAKKYQRPVVVVNAVRDREPRSFPYVGNVPVIRWNGEPEEVIYGLLRETLRHAHAVKILDLQKRPGDHLLPSGPELVTLVDFSADQKVLYPDPPLGQEELSIIGKTGITVETPLQRYAQAHGSDLGGLIVALSVSEATDIERWGLRQIHMDVIFLELSRYLLLAGCRLAYGGHLQANGYTLRLADILSDPLLEQMSAASGKLKLGLSQLVSYIAWPMPLNDEPEARLGLQVDVMRCERPHGIDESMDPLFVAMPLADIPNDTAIQRFAWSRGLSEMRLQQTRDCFARVVIGGSRARYKGRMPGVLEEIVLSVKAEKPVFLIGAFGGCAKLVTDTLEGKVRHELDWAFQKSVPFSDELRSLYRDRGIEWDEYDAMRDLLKARGFAGLNNGLSEDENKELAHTRSADRMIELILSGIHDKRNDGAVT